jgi:hypothetical protein
MGAFTVSQDALSAPSPFSESGTIAPSRQSLQRPFPKNLPKDPVGRDITILLFNHPELVAEFGEIKLKHLAKDDQTQLLVRIREKLGIKPTKSRRLPYVGP